MSEENSVSSQVEEYEDDFEKDLDWLINEETKNSDEDPEDYEDDENIEAKIDKELGDEEAKENKDDEKNSGSEIEKSNNKGFHNNMKNANEEEIRTTISSAPKSDTCSESLFQELKQEDQQDEEQSEEVKRYIMEKIEQANKELKDENPVNQNRERRLKFKDNLVDLEVPPVEFTEIDRDNGEITGPMCIKYISNNVQKDNDKEVTDQKSGKCISNDAQKDNDGEVTDQMSQMHISNDAQKVDDTERQWDDDKNKNKEVLMEKDGKFELLSLQDFENQGLLPQISVAFSENEWEQPNNLKGKKLSSSQNNLSPSPTEVLNTLKLQLEQKDRVTSPPKTLPRRTQSAVVTPKQSAHLLIAEHKEINWKTQQKKEQPKASEDFRDPNDAFNLWLKKKREQQFKEQQIETMRKREQDYNSRLHSREDSEKAFKQWLKRKKAEKRAEQLAAKERCKKFLLEARKVKRMQTLLCTLNESKSFQFDNYGYRF
ncbi:coiled-coil domain-containing protein 181 isoform X2 [Leucoraja erinacea]|uniref:coiled-coil domain-containing protein 181 isoform X2 n=1 Tax=Leucoraja erinaceus TaxID=7782 RepID=UPI0024559CBE|nr:coiled-coil domain-containing protein 181 isoform X2 [Leucoraja erinacea]